MINVTDYNNIQVGTEVKVIASYEGFHNYVNQLNQYVGKWGIINEADNDTLEITFNNDINERWWYPYYSLQFPGDTKSINKENALVGKEYIIMRKLNLFVDDIYIELR